MKISASVDEVVLHIGMSKYDRSGAIFFIYNVILNIHFTCINRDLYSHLLSIFTEEFSYVFFKQLGYHFEVRLARDTIYCDSDSHLPCFQKTTSLCLTQLVL